MTDEDARKAGDQLQAHLDAMDVRDTAARREATAATILAALIEPMNWGSAQTRWNGDTPIVESVGAGDKRHIAYAVALTGALRAALGEKP